METPPQCYNEIRKPGAYRVKLINFEPESIVPNIVEGFFDIQEGRYYMFAPIEAFHDGLRETEKMVIC